MPRQDVPPVPPSVPGYTLLTMLGKGSYGSVWSARDAQGHRAALKIIDSDGSRASQLELNALETMKHLRHRHLVSVFTSFALGNRRIVVMELAEGTLGHRLKYCRDKEGLPGIPPDELLHYMGHAADALDYLHGLNFIHRDIKPDNLLLFHDTEPYIKLGDCGLLRKQRNEDETATVIGTPGFMAPEVWKHKAGSAADRYNLAITYVELRQGYRPYSGSNIASVARAHLEMDPDLAGLLPGEIDVVRQALAKDPQQRFERCEDFVEALGQVLGPPPRSFRGRRVALLAETPVPVPAALLEPPPVSALPPADESRESDGTFRPGGDNKRVELDCPPTHPEPYTISPTPPAPMPAPPLPKKPPKGAAAWLPMGLVALLGAVGLLVAVSLLRNGNGEPPPPDPPEDSPPIVMPPPPPPLRVPAGFRPAPTSVAVSINGKHYPSCLVCEKAGPEERFWLLRPRVDEKDDPLPFYLLENKLTNRLYRKFASENSQVAGESWKAGGRAAGKNTGDKDDLPALRMTRDQATACAAWLGGKLPTCQQLDRAAAWTANQPPDKGPFRVGAAIAVGRRDKGPSAVGGPEDEGNVCEETKIRGLAGNGNEWTSDTVGELAVLRGRSYAATGALTYKLLGEFRDAKSNVTLTQRPDQATAYTGFRVAVGLPAE